MAARSHLARPPYVDPNTNIIYDTDNPEYEGWLTKQSMWLKVRRGSWQHRKFPRKSCLSVVRVLPVLDVPALCSKSYSLISLAPLHLYKK
jgi:hypothetical protein